MPVRLTDPLAVPSGLSGPVIAWDEIDERIRPLVRVLNAPEQGIVTLGSCSGHRHEAGYVDVAVRGMAGVRLLVALVEKLQAAAPRVWVDVALNWSHEVATACDFDAHPEWVMFSIALGDESSAPTTRELAKLAKVAGAFLARCPSV